MEKNKIIGDPMKKFLISTLIASSLMSVAPSSHALLIANELGGDRGVVLGFITFVIVGGWPGFFLMDEAKQADTLNQISSQMQKKYTMNTDDANAVTDLIVNKARMANAKGLAKAEISQEELSVVVSEEFAQSENFSKLANELK